MWKRDGDCVDPETMDGLQPESEAEPKAERLKRRLRAVSRRKPDRPASDRSQRSDVIESKMRLLKARRRRDDRD